MEIDVRWTLQVGSLRLMGFAGSVVWICEASLEHETGPERFPCPRMWANGWGIWVSGLATWSTGRQRKPGHSRSRDP